MGGGIVVNLEGHILVEDTPDTKTVRAFFDQDFVHFVGLAAADVHPSLLRI